MARRSSPSAQHALTRDRGVHLLCGSLYMNNCLYSVPEMNCKDSVRVISLYLDVPVFDHAGFQVSMHHASLKAGLLHASGACQCFTAFFWRTYSLRPVWSVRSLTRLPQVQRRSPLYALCSQRHPTSHPSSSPTLSLTLAQAATAALTTTSVLHASSVEAPSSACSGQNIVERFCTTAEQ